MTVHLKQFHFELLLVLISNYLPVNEQEHSWQEQNKKFFYYNYLGVTSLNRQYCFIEVVQIVVLISNKMVDATGMVSYIYTCLHLCIHSW